MVFSRYFRGKFSSKLVTFSARNTNIYKICKLRRAIFSVFYNILPTNFAILLVLRPWNINSSAGTISNTDYHVKSQTSWNYSAFNKKWILWSAQLRKVITVPTDTELFCRFAGIPYFRISPAPDIILRLFNSCRKIRELSLWLNPCR